MMYLLPMYLSLSPRREMSSQRRMATDADFPLNGVLAILISGDRRWEKELRAVLRIEVQVKSVVGKKRRYI